MKYYFRNIIVLIALSLYTFAQESEVTQNYQGKDYTQLKHAWTAQWITHPTASTLDYGVFHFRKAIQIESKPEKFIVHVSADNRYRLFVNSKQVCFGPSLGDIDHYRYETIDIAPYLTAGKNVISAEVVNFGEYRRAAQQTFQMAFILQGDKNNIVDVNTGSTEWKVIKNDAYTVLPFTSDSLKTYYAAGPGEKIDGKRYPWGWQTGTYNDSMWLVPKKGTVEFAVGRGFLYGSTWFLVPRTIPFMEESYERFRTIARTEGITISDDSFLDGKHSLKIQKHSAITILLDQTYHTTGFPELTYSKGKNSEIKITYSEALIKNISTNEPVSDGNLLKFDLKGDRNVLDGKNIFGYYDIIIPDGGEKRFFKPLSRKTYRFVQLDIVTQDEDLILDNYHGVYTVYPFEEKAKFNAGNEQLTKIWNTAWRTLRNSAEESFFDPYYEQLQYIGDTRIEALISIYVSGDDRLMRNAIEQFDDSRIPDGLTQSRYPSYIVQVIPTYSLLWVGMVHDYYMYRDDPTFVKKFLPGITSVLDWFAQRVDSTGLIGKVEWWNFTDWTDGFPNGIPPGTDDGYSANVSLQYVYALQQAIALYKHFGMNYEAKKYENIARIITASVNKLCYDKQKQLIAETPDKKQYSQHANVFAILTDAIGKEKQKSLMEKILTDGSLIPSTIYFKFYVTRALQKVGLGNKYVEMLSPWKNMITNNMTTFGETDINPRSDCHAWSASPCFDFLHTIAGIYPAEPGFKTVMIEPNFGYLKNINAELPHLKGQIKVELYKSEKNKITGTIILPDSLYGNFIYKGKKLKIIPGKNVINY